MKAKDLKQDSRNYRRHNEKNRQRIRKSIDECGFGRSVVIDADGVLVAGNGVHSVIDKNTPVRVVETDGTELVVVRRTDLHEGDEKRRMLALADNATSDHVEWEKQLIMEDFGAEVMRDYEIGIEYNEEQSEYDEFTKKFEDKLTTDDCFTPKNVYKAVKGFVVEKFGLKDAKVIRPFYPNGNYQKEEYPEGSVVIDNPPPSPYSAR